VPTYLLLIGHKFEGKKRSDRETCAKRIARQSFPRKGCDLVSHGSVLQSRDFAEWLALVPKQILRCMVPGHAVFFDR
jgi:hypothetical protein